MQKVFAVPDILTASILYVLYRKQLRYFRCYYAFDRDQYQFWFEDRDNVGPSAIAELRSKNENNPVPARAFKQAMNRMFHEFRQEQRRVGNPKSLAVDRG